MVRILGAFLAIFLICGGISYQAHAAEVIDEQEIYSLEQEIVSKSRSKTIRIRPGSGKRATSKQKFPKPPVGNMKRQ